MTCALSMPSKADLVNWRGSSQDSKTQNQGTQSGKFDRSGSLEGKLPKSQWIAVPPGSLFHLLDDHTFTQMMMWTVRIAWNQHIIWARFSESARCQAPQLTRRHPRLERRHIQKEWEEWMGQWILRHQVWGWHPLSKAVTRKETKSIENVKVWVTKWALKGLTNRMDLKPNNEKLI